MHIFVFLSSTGVVKNNRNVDALSRYPVESEPHWDDGIIANEVQTVSMEEMSTNFGMMMESTLSQQITQIGSKLKAAIESLDVGTEKVV